MVDNKNKPAVRELRNANVEPEAIRVGHVYKNNDTNEEVTPFFVDHLRGLVRFAPLGSSRETEMRVEDFRREFSYVGAQSAERAEKPVSKRASDKE